MSFIQLYRNILLISILIATVKSLPVNLISSQTLENEQPECKNYEKLEEGKCVDCTLDCGIGWGGNLDFPCGPCLRCGGNTYSDSYGQEWCEPCSECLNGETLIRKCTPESDTHCVCMGYHTEAHICLPCTECSENQQETPGVPCTQDHDRECEAKPPTSTEPPPVPDPNAQDNSEGLTTGEKIGTGTGIAAGIIVILTGMASCRKWLIKKYKKRGCYKKVEDNQGQEPIPSCCTLLKEWFKSFNCCRSCKKKPSGIIELNYLTEEIDYHDGYLLDRLDDFFGGNENFVNSLARDGGVSDVIISDSYKDNSNNIKQARHEVWLKWATKTPRKFQNIVEFKPMSPDHKKQLNEIAKNYSEKKRQENEENGPSDTNAENRGTCETDV